MIAAFDHRSAVCPYSATPTSLASISQCLEFKSNVLDRAARVEEQHASVPNETDGLEKSGVWSTLLGLLPGHFPAQTMHVRIQESDSRKPNCCAKTENSMKRLLIVVPLTALIALVGCVSGVSQSGVNSGQPVLKSIRVTPTSASVAAGLTVQLTATGAYSDGTSKDLTSSVTWTSSDTSIATVANTGVLTGKVQGSATISASSGSIAAKTSVFVTAPLVTSITAINPSSKTIAAFTQQQFRAIAMLTDGTSSDITHLVKWTISPTGVATISNTAPTQGLVTAGNPSSTTTTTVTTTCSLPTCVAQSGTPSLSATLTVTNATPTSIAISPTSKTIGWGNQLQFASIGTFSDGTTQDITDVCSWVSSNPSLVFITSSSGLAIGKSVGGPALIKATFRTIISNQASVSVDLSNLVSIAVTPGSVVIANGTQLGFSAIGTFVDGSTRNLASTNAVSWNSSSTAVATISSNGLAVSAGTGTTTITATAGGISGSTTLDVESATLQSMAVAPTNASIAIGTQLNFTAVGTFVGCSNCPFQQVLTNQPTTIWNSSTSAATITSNGLATGNAAGSTTITASSSLSPGGVFASVPLTVTSATLIAITVTPANTFVPPGANVLYKATGLFSDNTTQTISGQVTWSTSNSSVATITSFGLATAQGQGTVNISAKFGSVTGTTSLLVTSSALVSIAITLANARVAEKTAALFKATGTFADGSVQNLTTSVQWGSNNQTVATIGAQSGILTALTPGSTSVTAVYGLITGQTSVTVTNATLVSITITPSSATVNSGGSVSFSATGKFSDGTTQNLINASWSSSNPSVAIISNFGLATSSGVGTSTISATLNGVTGTAVLTVQ
jgi:uncharacterized protein YjdB